MNFRVLFVIGLLFSLPLVGRADEEGAPPSRQVVAKALQWMQASDPERRQAAYRSVHLLGKEAMPAFRQALRKALQYHERRLASVIGARNRGGNPYRDLEAVMDELARERDRVYPLMMRDWKKKRVDIDKLREEFNALEALYQHAAKLAAADTADLDRQISDITDALVEIHDQLARFEGQTQEEASELGEAERTRDALNESFDGHTYLKAAQLLGEMRSEIAQLESANSQNENAEWASAEQKAFAKLISYERTVLGLNPLGLDEKLSAAATGHSQDMRSLSFFSHTSPVEGKASFGDRARKAGFQGAALGECIAAGYGSASAAYRGWFYSDGHRVIMLARGPNLLGIGPVGGTWTLVTGRR